MNAQDVLDDLRKKYPDKDFSIEFEFKPGEEPEGYVDPCLVEITGIKGETE